MTSRTQVKEVRKHDVLRDDEPLHELPRIGARPRSNSRTSLEWM